MSDEVVVNHDLEKILERLQKYIRNIDISAQDVPVGVMVPASGTLVLVLYSLSFGASFITLQDAANHIAEFLDNCTK